MTRNWSLVNTNNTIPANGDNDSNSTSSDPGYFEIRAKNGFSPTFQPLSVQFFSMVIMNFVQVSEASLADSMFKTMTYLRLMFKNIRTFEDLDCLHLDHASLT